ncbi:MAG TPA: ABC transporter ATP-binding protein [Clostridiales bacterium]|nr:ABC transporter ATP-binding protein [Clostridiales bacterium]
MRLFFKELKKSAALVVVIAILLIIQATCDLSLPSYTSDIINVGIQQGGITSNVPDVIRESSLQKLSMYMTNDDKEIVFQHFIEVENNGEYPLVIDEPIYEWDGEEEELLQDILSLPMLIKMGTEMSGNMVSDIPIEKIESVLPQIIEEAEQLPELILNQSGIAFVKQEYEAMGLNVSSIQNKYILQVGAKMVGLALLVMALAISVTFLASRIAARIGKDLRIGVFEKVIAFSNKEMDEFSTASLITRSTNDIQQVQILTVLFLRIVLYSPILAIGGIIKILNTNLSMAWILAAGVGAILLLVAIVFAIAMPKFKQMQVLVDKINLVMREVLTGLPVIRAFSTDKYEMERFDKANNNLTKNSLFVNRTMAFMMPIMMLLMNFMSILIVWVGAKYIDNGSMQVGDMMAFIQYAMQIIMSFLMLTMVSIVLPRASVSATRINEVLNKDIAINDPISEEEMNENLKGVVEFKDVSFKYPNAEANVISNISFITKPGETTAIIGSTGSGKSTLINLIPRFYDIDQGEILVNGVNIKKIKQKNLRDKIGYIPQKGVLFSGTIESNIKFSDNDAPDEIMEHAAKIAQAKEFIDSKTDMYQDTIAQGGTNVSGGQKQRLSIARAIAKQPEIFIFDDSFSALDFKTDLALRRALKKEITNASIIIVAQRISTIVDAEQILVLDEGQIVGRGSHKELLKTCEVYKQIAVSQLSKEELEYE